MNGYVLALRCGDAFNKVMSPYFSALQKVGVNLAPSPEETLGEILGKLKEPIKWLVSTVFLIGVIFFVYKAVNA